VRFRYVIDMASLKERKRPFHCPPVPIPFLSIRLDKGSIGKWQFSKIESRLLFTHLWVYFNPPPVPEADCVPAHLPQNDN
jgi:hypothetical protein